MKWQQNETITIIINAQQYRQDRSWENSNDVETNLINSPRTQTRTTETKAICRQRSTGQRGLVLVAKVEQQDWINLLCVLGTGTKVNYTYGKLQYHD